LLERGHTIYPTKTINYNRDNFFTIEAWVRKNTDSAITGTYEMVLFGNLDPITWNTIFKLSLYTNG
jgi:hypothetical protein